MPMPPLMQSVARPFFALRFCISWSSVTTTRHASLPRPPKIPDQHNYPAADDIAICKPPKIPLLPEESKPHVVQHHCCSFWPCWGLLPRLFTCYCTLKLIRPKSFRLLSRLETERIRECCNLYEFGIQCDIKVGTVMELSIPRVAPCCPGLSLIIGSVVCPANRTQSAAKSVYRLLPMAH